MSKIQSILQKYLQELANSDIINQNEHTGRTPLENLLNQLKEQFALKNIAITHEGKRDKDGNGAPDFTINDNQKSTVIGYIENKKIDENLNKILKSKQIEKYKKLSENIILTDYLEWIWIYKDTEPVRIRLCHSSDLENPKFKLDLQKTTELADLIYRFYSIQPDKIATAKELAQKLARPSIEIKKYLITEIDNQIKEENENQRDELFGVYNIFKNGLFEDLNSQDFADGFAQMLTYSVFLAKLNTSQTLTLNNVKNSIPEAFGLIKTLDKFLDLLSENRHREIKWAVENILSVINNIDSLAIGESLSSKYGDEEKDPYIYFYEDFLKEYDSETRSDRGVYYTPPAVVQFIISQVSQILEKDFGLTGGLKNNQVKLLDFATGTGTFLFESYKQVLNGTQAGSFENNQLIQHLLNNFYGFEIMISSYIISHLKLSQFLKEKGYDLATKQNQRIGVYLTNTLENKQEFLTDYTVKAVSEEGKKAKEIKGENQIIAIVGNPPYNVSSQNILHDGKGEKEGDKNSLKAFHQKYKPSDEKKLNMDDDYIKFIAFAHKKINSSGKGIVGIIVNNSFLKGITHRRMRNELMKDFDKIYVVDLHGNARIGEISPDGMADQNVFDIMQGVCIILLIKNPNIKDKGVYHLDIFGKRKAKLKGIAETRQGQFTKLEIAEFNQNFRSTKWGQNRFQDDLSFFAPMREAKAMIEYGEFWGLTEIFEQVSGGVKTDRDELAIDFESQKLQEKMQIAFEGNYDNEFKEKYNITNSSSYNFADKLKQGNFDENVIHNIDYRPFDTRNIYYKQGFTSRPAFETMQHILKGENLGLIFMRGFTGTDSFNQIQISNNLVDINFYGFQTYFAPLYIYKDEKENKKDQQVTLDEKWENIQTKKPNFTKQFQEFIKTKFGNVSPEAVLGFIYSQMHSPVYRSKFLELLKIDFPRVNFEVSPQEFERLAKIGQEMIEIHLMKKIPEIETKIDCFAPDFDNVVVEKVRYNEVLRRVYLNEKTYFEKISPKVWNYKIGGYQVLDKYLKSRKDRLLSHEEIGHFKDVVRVLEWTIGVAEGLKQ